MSRIFDALQRSGLEQTGVEYPDMVAIATEVLDSPKPTVREIQVVREPSSNFPPSDAVESGAMPNDFPVFASVDAHVSPGSRLVYFAEPHGLAAEKFRFLGVRLRQLRQNRTLRKVLITSSIPEEGKSLVAANLAGVLARRKARVLLIEGDLRRPTLAPRFGLDGLNGLAESLQSGQEMSCNIYHLRGLGFWLMPAGTPPANPLELIQSSRLSQLMAELELVFDWILIDSPPLLPLADTTVWQRFADGTLLVVREGITEKKALQGTIDVLKKSDLLGVVLNGCSNSNYQNYYQRYSSVPEVK